MMDGWHFLRGRTGHKSEQPEQPEQPAPALPPIPEPELPRIVLYPLCPMCVLITAEQSDYDEPPDYGWYTWEVCGHHQRAIRTTLRNRLFDTHEDLRWGYQHGVPSVVAQVNRAVEQTAPAIERKWQVVGLERESWWLDKLEAMEQGLRIDEYQQRRSEHEGKA